MVLGLVVSNAITAGADLGAIGEAVHLVVPPIPAKVALLPAAIGITLVLALGGYELIRRVFKWLTLVLFAYVGAGILARPDVGQVLRGTFVPSLSFDSQSLSNLVALLGATGSPYLMFWQAREEVEEQIEQGRARPDQRRGTTRAELRYSMWDVIVGMIVSQLIAYFVQIATAATLHNAGQTEIESAADAAKALQPLAGNAAGILFALGLIGAGCLAIPVLAASAAFAIAEVLGWRAGLDQPFTRARRFYVAIASTLCLGLVINFVGINPFQALFLASLIFGLMTPPLLLLVLLIANNRRIMGAATPGRWLNALGVVTLLTNLAGALGLLLTGGK
jgi:Mn2+/Fe2+ NRAMP family transporter